ncbi:MAG: metallophosphoesterase family protein [Firmicutes bacterium]|nr:metallophosphoesterase family protein [Bacillota bacterium]
MRIAVLSDIHGNLPALQAVLADIEGKQVDKIFCLGDLVGYGPWPNEVIDLLRQRDIPCVQGNYDESVGEELLACGCDFADADAARLGEISLNWTIDATNDENKSWLRELPQLLPADLAGYRLLLVHGSPRQNNEYLTFSYPAAQLERFLQATEADILLCGHTHLAFHRQIGSKHVVNAGSAGKPKHGNPNVIYQLLELGKQVSVTTVEVPYDYARAAQAIVAAGLPEEFARIVRTGNS